ncbi:MAG TPA: hypothetical protein VGX28_13000 [Frankiaceae bacterium]|nr:hypothetical protein [Frankiaceae bacterium]
MPPLWLLDVDGVLNAVSATVPRAWAQWRTGEAVADGVAWPIRYAPTLVRTIAGLHERGLVECRWLTTWGDAANEDLRRLLGLPAFRVAAPPPAPSHAGGGHHGAGVAAEDSAAPAPGWWKLAAVRALLTAERRPVIWTDDELRHHPEAVAWVRSCGVRSLLLSPRPDVGLTPRDLRDVQGFCQPRMR